MHGGMKKMFEPLLMKECRMASVDDNHPLWPEEAGSRQGAGAVVPLTSEDLSLDYALVAVLSG